MSHSWTIELNKKIGNLGCKGHDGQRNLPSPDWSSLLSLAEKESENFDHINYATLMSQLGRLRGEQMRQMKADKRFRVLLRSLEKRMVFEVRVYSTVSFFYAVFINVLFSFVRSFVRGSFKTTDSSLPLPPSSPSSFHLLLLLPHSLP